MLVLDLIGLVVIPASKCFAILRFGLLFGRSRILFCQEHQCKCGASGLLFYIYTLNLFKCMYIFQFQINCFCIFINQMSINIFQFLKQGTTLSSKSIQKNRELQQKITPKQKTRNEHYFKTGKFNEEDDNAHDKKGDQWEELNEQNMKHEHNKKKQHSCEVRKKNKIRVEGIDAPFVVEKFQELKERYKVNDRLMAGLAEMGFKKPTAVQMQALPAMLEDRNVLITAPTGTGKTVSYLLPLIQNILKKRQQLSQKHKEQPQKSTKASKKSVSQSKQNKNRPAKQTYSKMQALIIAPHQQLSTQIVNQLMGLTKALRQSQQITAPIDNINFKCISALDEQQLDKISKNQHFGVNVLVATPQIFLNLFGSEANKISLFSQTKYIVLDQCDKYFEQSFVQQIRTILQFLSPIKPKPVYCLLSATIQHPIQQLLKTQLLDDPLRIQVGGQNKVLTNIEQSIEYCTNEYGKILQLKNMISENRFIPPAILFVQEKARAKQLYYEVKKIMKNGPAGLDLSKKVEVLTGDKSKEERKEILDKFEKGVFLILITTDLVARGIDFSHVNLVINYDFPNTMLTYIHRVGRTGRAERTGYAVTFFTDQDKPIVKSLANLLSVSGCKVPGWILELPNVDRKLKKKLQKRPLKRLPVGVSEGRDKNFGRELEKMQKIWQRKKQRQIERQKKQKQMQGQQEQESSGWIQA